MKIRKVDAFDPIGNGTMVVKTDMEKDDADYRYAWYVMSSGREVLHKVPYQKEPYMAWQVPGYGPYLIKAFVKRRGEKTKIIREITFRADKASSPDPAAQEVSLLSGPPTVERISGPFYKMRAVPDPSCTGPRYAWYVYRTGSPDPVIKRMYQDSPEYVCALHEPGGYFVKAFVLADGKKDSMKSEIFMVE